jgi:hypothetical protein
VIKPGDTVVRFEPHQIAAFQAETRFDVRVWHRRAGKTFYTIVRKLMRLQAEGKGDWQAFYFAPTRTQAKQIAWPYLVNYAKPLGGVPNVAELKVTVPGKGFIQLMNGEQFDRARGLYMDDCTIDEAADVPRAAWTEVISPALSDREGRLSVMGTPRGRMNLLYDLWDLAGGDDPDWSRSLLTVYETGMVKPAEIERNKRQQTEAQFNQEWLCSFDGATPGAFWGKVMSNLDQKGRITTLERDPNYPLIAALDLGHSDLMPVIFMQEIGNQPRILRCETYQFTSIPDMVRDWKDKGLNVDRLILPHDAKVTELGSGQTRQQVFRNLGVTNVLAPNVGLMDGIEQTRVFLERCWFNRSETAFLREALAQYRSEYDEIRGVHRLTPIHDQASHYADAMRYLAIGNRAMSWGNDYEERPSLRGTI